MTSHTIRPAIRLQTKLILLFGGILSLLLLGLLILKYYEQHRGELLIRDAEEERQHVFDRIVELRGSSLEALAYDYTFWDEMVRFIETSDLAWAREMLDTGMTTFKTDGIWVFRVDGTMVYAVTTSEDETFKQPPLPAPTLQRVFRQEPYFHHFFVETPKGVLEVRTASVHPTSDEERLTPPQGFFITGRLWTGRYLQELMRLTGSTIELIPVTGAPLPRPGYDRRTGQITFSRFLRGWDDRPLLRVDVSSPYPLLHQLNRMSGELFVVYLFLGAIALLMLSGLLTRWITRPVGLITKSLDVEAPDLLSPLQTQRTEMGRLAQLIIQFFKQKQALDEANMKLRQHEAMKSSFIANVAYELRPPLSAVQLSLKNLADGLLGQLSPPQKSTADECHNTVGRLVRLTTDLIGLTDTTKGTPALHLDVFGLKEALTEMVKFHEPYLREHEQSVSLQLPPEPLMFFGDEGKLKQAFGSLIDYAMRWSPRGGVIAVELAVLPQEWRMTFSHQVSEGHPDPARALDPFNRTGERSEPSLGLALHLVKGIVELHHGRFWVEGHRGKDNRLILSLPALDVPSSAAT